MIIEADGDGPPTDMPRTVFQTPDGPETDRRPLLDYYAKIGFQPLSATTVDLSQPVLHYVPVGATIGSLFI